MNTRRIKILRRKSWVGKLLRLPFDMIPKSAVLRVFSGPLKGFKWVKGSHNISVLLGTYERRQSALFIKKAKSSPVFWDLGAHVGYYSLLYAKSNPSGKIYAFEPMPNNVSFYNRHMTMNGLKQYEIFTSAVSDMYSKLSFNTAASTVAGRLSETGNVVVDVVKLSDMATQGKIEIPQLIKMDIEGEEVKVLADLKQLLADHKPSVFLSTHGAEVHKKCVTFLTDLNYTLTPLDSDTVETSKEILAVKE